MMIQEVCRRCRLTKKAVAYYEEQGLITPELLENGYRDFSDADVSKLEKIAVLRGLGLSVAEIRTVLSEQNMTALQTVSDRKRLELASAQEKQALLQTLATEENWEDIRIKLWQLEQKQSIAMRLLKAFPGYYGRYLSLHFAAYLHEPIATDDQQEAFDTVISFLDQVRLEIPSDLQDYLEQTTEYLDADFAETASRTLQEVATDPEQYLAVHREAMEVYLAFKQSEEYRVSPAYRLEQLLKQFMETSGYNTIFLPAMRRLSPAYQRYCDALERANEVFLQQYPQGESRGDLT